ncbi:hypothetical protein K503DRAFT_741496 [Rhizopogon vinicolor AM-OR11-026]|uniref:F-box domain-containing protein n=1 Tax=Rhizopogon vinicolor AM-OR11-026 TaxID=1314800 RepID=A0A1B7N071_9AGAM|nr:hypothetical protein K503DRAFT_741496 [Rhizopogon vinicolor AM-OR11-026]
MYLPTALFRCLAVLYRRWSKSDNKTPPKPKSNQDNDPPILKLPPDVLEYCWSYLRRPDLFHVSCVCRIFWRTSRFRIFHSLIINLSSPPMLPLNQKLVLRSTKKSSNMLEPATTRVTSFYSDPDARELWDIVQAWTVTAPLSALSTFSPFRVQKHEQTLALRPVDTVFQLLSCSRNLRSLELARLDLGREQWVTLQSLPALETLRLISCFFSSSSHSEPLKLKGLEIAGGSFGPRSIDGYLVSVLCNPAYLEKLTLIDSFVAPTALEALSSMEHFPHLSYLSVLVKSFSRGHFLRFLAAIPSLTTLNIFPSSVDITPDHPLPALSSLRSYNGYPHLLSRLVPGRPVDRVCLVLQVITASNQSDDYTFHADLVSNMLDISCSTVPVRRLKIDCFLPTLQRLSAIAKYLPDLHCLDLVLISASPPLIPVGVILTLVLSRIVNALLSPQEDSVISSSFEDLDYASNPLNSCDTMGVRRIAILSLCPHKTLFRAF